MKNERRAKIIELIGQYPIETQEELAERLEKSGFPVTQATISRDIRELKLTKVSVDGVHQKYTLLQEKETNLAHKYIRVLQDGYLSMDQAENLLVNKDDFRNGNGSSSSDRQLRGSGRGRMHCRR